MKRSTKIIVILSSVLILIGLVMVSVSFAMTGGDILTYKTDENYEKIEEVYESGEVSAITLSARAQDVILRPSSDGKLRVIRYENETISFLSQKLYYVLDGDKSIHLKITENEPYQKKPVLGYLLQLNNKASKVIIEIPNAQENISIQTKSGDITFSGISVNEALTLKSVSGDITASTLSVGMLSVSTTSGDIRLTDGNADSLTCSAVSGDITVNGVNTKAPSSLETVSGDVDCLSYTSDGHFTVTTTSGDIETENTMLVSADFVSTSGDIDLHLLTNPNRPIYVSWKSVSGTVRHIGKPKMPQSGTSSDDGNSNVPLSMESIKGNLIRTDTVSGDIHLDFDPS